MRIKSLLLALLCIFLFCPPALAQLNIVQPIPPEQAFQFSASARDSQTVLVMWKIAPGYYLYRDRMHFSSNTPSKIRLGQPLLPAAMTKAKPEVGPYAVYENSLTIPLPIIKADGNYLDLRVTYQGCSESGYCYPPITKVARINLTSQYMTPVAGITIDTPAEPVTSNDRITQLLNNQSTWMLILGFFGFGLLIAFTPCVLPMVPILSGIILGHKKITHWHAFLLSLSYVLGTAITYAVAGMIFGYIGGTVQAVLQKPWIIAAFSVIFVLLACGLFGFYHLQLPESIRGRFALLSQHQKHGTYFGVFLMGCFSTLILSPCVTPPLVAVLGYISQTGNAALGGLILFSMGLGMGLPLLIIGAFSSRLLPKAGPWMKHIEVLMGVMLLAVAIYMLARIMPVTLNMLLWGALFVGYGVYLGALSSVSESLSLLRKTMGILFFIYGVVIIVGASSRSINPWNPLYLSRHTTPEAGVNFITIQSSTDLARELTRPENANKPVLLDFYADWCVSCKVMEAQVFNNQAVKKVLSGFVLLRANVTANSEENKTLERQFNVIAPPTILIFDKQHKEIPSARIVGEMSAQEFLQHLNQQGI